MGRRIRLFLDAHTFDNEFQGSRTFIKYLYNVLVTNYDFEFYFAAHDIENLKETFGLHTNIHYIKYKFRSSSMRLAFELPFLLKRYKIDYAHFQYIVPPIKFCKYIVTTHDVLFHDFPDEFSWRYRLSKHLLFKISAKRADILTTVSEFSKRSISKWLKIDLDKIHVIPNAVDDTFFLQHDKGDSKLLILKKYKISNFCLIVSRIEPRKNQAAIIRAFKKLDLFRAGHSLVLIGSKSIHDSKLEKEISSLSEEESGKLYQLQGVSEDELLLFFNAADLSIYPSKAEGFGIPPLESGALKTPTLCSNVSAMADFVFFGKDLFNPFDESEIEEKIINSLNFADKGRLNEISTQIKQKYSWNNSGKLFYDLFK
jgi:glycosyltransferase involved in cell wall biosynthesis